MIRKLVLFTMLVVILLSTKVNASEVPVNHVKNTIVQHSVALGVDPAMALSIAKVESGYNHGRRSAYGAVGVFQLMPSTAAKLGVNPYHLADNIKGGILYYKMLYKMFGSTELALAAYNAGPANVMKHHSVPSYSKQYVSTIMAEYHRQKAHPSVCSKTKKSNNHVLAKGSKQSQLVLVSYKSAKPMTASVPRVISDGTNRLIIKKNTSGQSRVQKLQVTMSKKSDSSLS